MVKPAKAGSRCGARLSYVQVRWHPDRVVNNATTQVSNMKKRTNRYWPVFFWMYDVSGDATLKYKPSPFHAHVMRKCVSEGDALLYGLSRIKRQQTNNLQGMPSFIVKVIESETIPDVTASSTLRLFVERIPINS